MIIQCDVDNVLNNLIETTVMLFNNTYNKEYKSEDITTYDLSQCIDPDDAKRMKQLFNDPDLWNIVRPIKKSQESIKKLINDGHDVYLVTNNNPHTFGAKYDWIKYYFPFVNDNNIVCMRNKWMFNCDVMIEDCYENLIAKPFYSRILVDYPWNQSNKDYIYDIYRCTDWDEIITAINNINNMEE